MPVYNVTGKLGGGKTLWAVKKAFDALRAGRIVASNVDLFVDAVLPPWFDEARCRAYRIPDLPTRADLDALGVGNPTSDETKNGLLILDECGAILNARNYRDADRKDVIDWFLHARKLGWDIMFISQSHAMLDKQIRDGLVEYLVVCRRFDRFNVPGLAWLGIKLKLPKIHFALVRYGSQPRAMLADRDFFRGSDFYKAYSTRQLVLGEGQGLYCLLSPWHLKGRHMTKIQLAKIAARGAWLAGLALGVISTSIYFHFEDKPVVASAPAVQALPVALGVIRRSDALLVVLPDGRREIAHSWKTTQAGTVARVPSGEVSIPRGAMQ